ncbi:hypothetical protein K437DRAFT_85098 [Tilletiaria anomala UBC 951]|uniref:Uncharacterized protein n=1 Tax=Tilletiaria anomala (strain ATCC 24038 / CBS 436.72 / UBC 951) TaxID=1037660 RepID=A0A066V8T6_TILAU|nr:uncharacterized protein K437DRAFT_85098 [Tilletiaria anomala UBC 951]KDN35020.1 hypothetical protein K437DRAFT_85098 [Tilletiaria anomala UBC 951]
MSSTTVGARLCVIFRTWCWAMYIVNANQKLEGEWAPNGANIKEAGSSNCDHNLRKIRWLSDTLERVNVQSQGCETLPYEQICKALLTGDHLEGLRDVFIHRLSLHGMHAMVNMVKKVLVSRAPFMTRTAKVAEGETWLRTRVQKSNYYNTNKANRVLQTWIKHRPKTSDGKAMLTLVLMLSSYLGKYRRGVQIVAMNFLYELRSSNTSLQRKSSE